MPVSANTPRAAIIVERGDGKPIHVVGDDVIIKISSRDTEGRLPFSKGARDRFKVRRCIATATRMNRGTSSTANTSSKWTGRRSMPARVHRVRPARQPAYLPEHRNHARTYDRDGGPWRR